MATICRAHAVRQVHDKTTDEKNKATFTYDRPRGAYVPSARLEALRAAADRAYYKECVATRVAERAASKNVPSEPAEKSTQETNTPVERNVRVVPRTLRSSNQRAKKTETMSMRNCKNVGKTAILTAPAVEDDIQRVWIPGEF